MCIDNAKSNPFGHKGNRFSDEFIKVAIYIYIRGGKSLYEFFHLNLNFPALKTVQRRMLKFHKKLIENHFYFDELVNFLKINNYVYEVCILEDGTKITEAAEYDAIENLITGLVAPTNASTGIPIEKFFPALTAKQISIAIQNSPKASYVQVILAKPNDAGKVAFISHDKNS